MVIVSMYRLQQLTWIDLKNVKPSLKEESKKSTTDVVVCFVLLKSILVGGVVWNGLLPITWKVTLTSQLVVCVAFEN